MALSENALFPLTRVWLITLGGLLAAREPGRGVIWAAAFGLCGAALWAVHGRMITVVGLTIAVAVWLAARRGARLLDAATTILVLAAGVWGTHLLNVFLVTHNYRGHAINEVNERISALVGVHPLLTAFSNLVGQPWYLVVATFGLAAVGSFTFSQVCAVNPTAPARASATPWSRGSSSSPDCSCWSRRERSPVGFALTCSSTVATSRPWPHRSSLRAGDPG